MRGWISEKLGGVIDTIMDPLVSLLPSPPPQWQGIPRGVYDTGRDKMVEGIADGVAGLTDGLATVWNAVRNIPDLIRDALDGDDDINEAAAEGYHKGGLAGRGRGLMAKTALEPEMVLDPEMTKAFIEWMGVGRDVATAMGPDAAAAGRGFLESQATSLLDVVGLGGLVPLASGWVDDHGPAVMESARSLMSGDVTATAGLAPGGASIVIEASSMDDVVRVGDLQEVQDQVDGLEVKIDEKKKAPAATVTRGGVM